MPQRKQRRQRKQQQPEAHDRGNLRINRPAPQPPPSQNQDRRRQQKRRKPEDLEKSVRTIRANRSNPILRRRVLGRGDIKRRIFWRIGEQSQRNEDRQRDAQKPNQFVEPLVSSRSQ